MYIVDTIWGIFSMGNKHVVTGNSTFIPNDVPAGFFIYYAEGNGEIVFAD